MKNLEKIKGDASFRKFFRKKNKKLSSIIVFSNKEKFKNLLVYDAVNKILNKNGVLAPKLYQESYDKDYLEIQDFGNDTIFKILKKKNIINFSILKRLLMYYIKYSQLKIQIQ